MIGFGPTDRERVTDKFRTYRSQKEKQMISFGLIDYKRKSDMFWTYRPQKVEGHQNPKVRRKTDGPTTVRHVSLDIAGDVIPWGSEKRCPCYQG